MKCKFCRRLIDEVYIIQGENIFCSERCMERHDETVRNVERWLSLENHTKPIDFGQDLKTDWRD